MAMWAPLDSHPPDHHVAFRGTFHLDAPAELDLLATGSSWYTIWLDGTFLDDGPVRFHPTAVEPACRPLRLAAGRHVLALHATHAGCTTRLLLDMPPFLDCRLVGAAGVLPITWRCLPLAGHVSGVRRLNPQLGWIDWVDTRQSPAGWQSPDFDDSAWLEPAPAAPPGPIGPPADLAPLRHDLAPATLLAEGHLAESFGYPLDDPPVRFFLRELDGHDLPPMGVYRRFDLGRVRLVRPRLTLDVAPGTVVEFAYAEALTAGRVSPHINLSAGQSCNLDHFEARGGPQEFMPHAPRGARFVEVHVLPPAGTVRWLGAEFLERGYYPPTPHHLHTGDPLLDRIWAVGVETLRGCAEDAIIDNPTRERGEWTGDVATIAMDIASVCFHDLRPMRRGLYNSAHSARADGLVAGLCPGGPAYLPTYSALWTTAALRYHELTGDDRHLHDLHPAAERNIAAIEAFRGPHGITDDLGWIFVDWGYARPPGPIDIAFNLHVLGALESMATWCRRINRPDRATHHAANAARHRALMEAWRDTHAGHDPDQWRRLGLHALVLLLAHGLVPPPLETTVLDAIEAHYLRCFPNDPAAPRLHSPLATDTRLITPYFSHYALPLLIEGGRMDFVLDQYRRCWGWALGGGRTTWLEVFDTRWSHCHQWAGCPTWQLSRYLLGLHPAHHLGLGHYLWRLAPGQLPAAHGTLPHPGNPDGRIAIDWQRRGTTLHWTLRTTEPLHLHHLPHHPTPLRVDKELHLELPDGPH